MNKYFLYKFLCVCLVIKIYTIFSGDVLVSFGAAIQADYLGSFPENVYHSWNLRGIGYKYIIYGIYKLTSIFVEIKDTDNFHRIAKFIYFIIYSSISHWFIFLIRHQFSKSDKRFLLTIVLLIPLTNAFSVSMQPEEMALLFLGGYLSFIFSKSKILNSLSGIFILILFSLKIVTILYAFFGVLLAITFHEKIDLKTYFTSNILTILFSILLYKFALPLEITDLLNAVKYQNSFRFKFTTIPLLLLGLLLHTFQIPILLFLYSFFYLIFKRKKKESLLLFCFIFVSALIVIVQHKWFHYHYIAFVPVAILSLFWLRQQNIVYISNLYLILFATAFLFFSQFFIESSEKNIILTGFDYTHHKKLYEQLKKVRNSILFIPDFKNEEILFLSNGGINFFLTNRSYLREYYPLPLARVNQNTKLKESLIYKSTLSKALHYDGNYIFLEEKWFNISSIAALNNKIKTQYSVIRKFEYPENVFTLYKRNNN